MANFCSIVHPGAVQMICADSPLAAVVSGKDSRASFSVACRHGARFGRACAQSWRASRAFSDQRLQIGLGYPFTCAALRESARSYIPHVHVADCRLQRPYSLGLAGRSGNLRAHSWNHPDGSGAPLSGQTLLFFLLSLPFLVHVDFSFLLPT